MIYLDIWSIHFPQHALPVFFILGHYAAREMVKEYSEQFLIQLYQQKALKII